MALDLSKYKDQSMLEYVDDALEQMQEYLQESDLGVIGAIRRTAARIDDRSDTGNPDFDGNIVAGTRLVMQGLEKLGGSVASRRELGISDKPKESPLAAVRSIRDVPSDSKSRKKKPASRKQA